MTTITMLSDLESPLAGLSGEQTTVCGVLPLCCGGESGALIGIGAAER
jgi:hypothetical protein